MPAGTQKARGIVRISCWLVRWCEASAGDYCSASHTSSWLITPYKKVQSSLVSGLSLLSLITSALDSVWVFFQMVKQSQSLGLLCLKFWVGEMETKREQHCTQCLERAFLLSCALFFATVTR